MSHNRNYVQRFNCVRLGCYYHCNTLSSTLSILAFWVFWSLLLKTEIKLAISLRARKDTMSCLPLMHTCTCIKNCICVGPTFYCIHEYIKILLESWPKDASIKSVAHYNSINWLLCGTDEIWILTFTSALHPTGLNRSIDWLCFDWDGNWTPSKSSGGKR